LRRRAVHGCVTAQDSQNFEACLQPAMNSSVMGVHRENAWAARMAGTRDRDHAVGGPVDGERWFTPRIVWSATSGRSRISRIESKRGEFGTSMSMVVGKRRSTTGLNARGYSTPYGVL
jgi:hypothetical protein